MKANIHSEIVTDIEKFQERVVEITSQTSYDAVKHCISEIKKMLYKHPEIPALCAPQIGESLRLFVVRVSKTEENRFKAFLNPLIVSSEGLHLSRETNASILDKEFIIPRKNKIHLAYQEPDGHVGSETYIGAYGEVIQQMVEMLDGITLADYGLDLDDVGGPKAFNRASQKMQREVIAMYLDSLRSSSEDLAKEIEANPDLKDINDTINFMTGMLTGDIRPISAEDMNKVENSGESDAI